MKRIVTFSLLALLFGCSNESKNLDEFLVDLSEFEIDQEALKNGEHVKILGSSGNLTREDKVDFYNLIVVKSEETGDTVNVLVTSFYLNDLNNPYTQFISNTSFVGKIFENGSDLADLNTEELNNLEAKTFDKVLYDTEYIQVDVRKYPAVTGTLGNYTVKGDLDDIKSPE